MLFSLFNRQVITRNYDVSSSSFSPLPLQNSANNFVWNSNLFSNLSAIFSSIFLSAIGYGILMVMIALKLEAHVKNEILMSVSVVTQIGAGVIFSRFLPMFGQKTGLVQSIIIGSLISALFALLTSFYINYFIWLVTIYFLGTSFFICGVTRNTIMIDMAPPKMRALIISIGSMLVAIGNSLGPIILNFTKTSDNLFSFILASFFYLISILPILKIKKINFDSELREEKKISIWRYIKNSPKIMFAGFSVSYAMSSSSAFLIIYGIRIGMPKDQASLLLSVLLFGTIFSIPIGYLADIFNRRLMMISSTILALIFSCSLYFHHNSSEIYVLLFLMFGSLAGVKLPAIVLINEKYKPTQRLAVNSAFSRFSLLGNICGLFVTGGIINCFGPQGLWISVSSILFFFLVFCCYNYWKKFANKEITLKDLSIFNKNQNEQIFEL